MSGREKVGQTDRQTDGQTDRQTDRQPDGRADGQTYCRRIIIENDRCPTTKLHVMVSAENTLTALDWSEQTRSLLNALVEKSVLHLAAGSKDFINAQNS